MQVSGDETTAAFRIKALLLYLELSGPTRSAIHLREQLGGDRLLADETAPVSRSLWLRALQQFAQLAGERSLRNIGPCFLDTQVLGVWAEVLRGIDSPDTIFSRLATGQRLPGAPAWNEFELDRGDWVGQVVFAQTDTPSERKLIAEALRSEAEILPALVGFSARAQLEQRPDGYWVRVRITGRGLQAWLPPLAGVLAGALPLGMAAIEPMHTYAGFHATSASVLTGGITSATLWLLRSDRRRQRTSRAQNIRIAALERESLLRRQTLHELSHPEGEPALAGQYRIGAQLGVGGSGAVWHATRIRDERPVALKLIRAGVAHDVRATDRLRREAEALGLAWHPNVVEIYDTGILPSGVAYLTMERLYGESLAERLLRHGVVPYETLRRFALDLAEALTAIHSAGLVHRDIKPGNLFVQSEQPDGESDKPPLESLKVIDFGVARVSWAETRLTRPGARIGTFGYAAPEQERGEDVDGRADLYAAGVTLRECLTGQRPGNFAQPSPQPESLAPHPAAFVRLIDALTDPEPGRRPASAREFRDLLLALPDSPSTVELDRNAG